MHCSSSPTARYCLISFLIVILPVCAVFLCILASKTSELNSDKHDFHEKKIIFVASVILLVVIISVILYQLWKIYRKENELILSSDKITQYAKAKSSFLASMSHEIRTPLNSIIGFSEQLAQTKLDERQTNQLKAICSSSHMLLDLVNDILDFSKYETHKIKFTKHPFVLADVINEVVKIITIQAIQKCIELKIIVSFDNTTCFHGDSLRLKQVLLNLLNNAIKFTRKGSVTLKASTAPNSENQSILNVEVIDTGIGMRTSDLDLIFDEFTQINHSETTIKGTGLGLAICKKIIEFQGGEIKATSEFGKGSTFSFSIPYELCENHRLEIKAISSKDTVNLCGKHILIAEDNKMNAMLMQMVLEKYKTIIHVAHNGHEALKLFEKNEYDLILTDIQMPKMDGIELTKAIRSYNNIAKQRTPIFGVTANVLTEDRELYLAAGMNDLVLKPFSEQEIIRKILLYLDVKHIYQSSGQSTVSSGC